MVQLMDAPWSDHLILCDPITHPLQKATLRKNPFIDLHLLHTVFPRVGALLRKLATEVKIRDAAQTLARLDASNSSPSQISRQSSSALETAEQKVAAPRSAGGAVAPAGARREHRSAITRTPCWCTQCCTRRGGACASQGT
jgi:hypothetical protein